jgi:membrane protease YdiL (CAAX protease family)
MVLAADPMRPGKRYLIAECAVLFFIAPAALYFVRTEIAFKIVPLMWAVALSGCVVLRKSGHLDAGELWRAENLSREVREILCIFLPSAVVMTLLAWIFIPDKFLSFPRSRPLIWFLVMVMYPVLMAYPQELFFRTFFFRRYDSVFSDKRMLMAANALSFGVAHSLYGNWLAPVLSTAGGFLFAWRYHRCGSVLIVSLEHAMWGNLLFTTGYGWYFYSGAIQ